MANSKRKLDQEVIDDLKKDINHSKKDS